VGQAVAQFDEDMTVMLREPPVLPVFGRQQLTLAVASNAVGLARAQVNMTLQQWGAPKSMRSDLLLVVTELVTNVVRHAAPPPSVVGILDLVLDLLPDTTVRAQVRDASTRPPVLRTVDMEAESGRGLRLVASFSKRWGSYPVSVGGKVVWADVHLNPEPSPASMSEESPPGVRLLGRVLEAVRDL
jgi:anti-sigma regulatory factor (Ser/Thr protein kinase)